MENEDITIGTDGTIKVNGAEEVSQGVVTGKSKDYRRYAFTAFIMHPDKGRVDVAKWQSKTTFGERVQSALTQLVRVECIDQEGSDGTVVYVPVGIPVTTPKKGKK